MWSFNNGNMKVVYCKKEFVEPEWFFVVMAFWKMRVNNFRCAKMKINCLAKWKIKYW